MPSTQDFGLEGEEALHYQTAAFDLEEASIAQLLAYMSIVRRNQKFHRIVTVILQHDVKIHIFPKETNDTEVKIDLS